MVRTPARSASTSASTARCSASAASRRRSASVTSSGSDGVGDGGRLRVLERTADRARGARGERARQLARHAVEPSLAQVEQLGAAVERG